MPKQIFFTVQPRGNHFRVIDQEGYAIGSQYATREAAQPYADALNMARNFNTLPPTAPQPQPQQRQSLLSTLRTLAAKVREYKHVRIGL